MLICRRNRRASVGRDSLCGNTMVKSFPTKTRRAARFFGSQSPPSKAPRKARIAGQSSTGGRRLPRYVSISPMRQILLAPCPFQIPQRRRSRANAVNDALPLPLKRHRLPKERSRESGEEKYHRKAILGQPRGFWFKTGGQNCLGAGGTESERRFESFAR